MAKISRRTFLKNTSYASSLLAIPAPFKQLYNLNFMTTNNQYDTIIIGGSYAGLSAAMALGRAMRNVLIIDGGIACNRFTPHAHNFITHDGAKPQEISQKAKAQVLAYPSVNFIQAFVHDAKAQADGFIVETEDFKEFHAKKLIFATGVKDIMPNIEGFSACWGKTIIHCPYCHGYEVRNQKTGILANGDMAFHYAQLISNWTKELCIFTNGKASFDEEQWAKLKKHQITVFEEEIESLNHEEGKLKEVQLKSAASVPLTAMYARPDFVQHSNLPEKLGCELTEQGLLKVDLFQKTTVSGVYACGDNASPLRALSYATATGTIAGAALNNELIEDEF